MWALIQALPLDSAWWRRCGVNSPLEEHLATLVDLLFHQTVVDHQQATFDPDRWPEHGERAREAKGSKVPPPDIPQVAAVAIRPKGWASLTAALTSPPEPRVEEVVGHEAHVRLQALLNDDT